MSTNVWKFLWYYMRRIKLTLVFLLGVFVVAMFFTSWSTFVISKMIGQISETDAHNIELWQWASYLGLYAFLKLSLSGLNWLRRYIEEVKIMPYYLAKISMFLFKCTHSHSINFFNEEMAGNISGKVNNILNNIQNFYQHMMFGLFYPVVGTLIIIFFIALEDFWLAILFLALNTIFFAITVLMRKRITPFSKNTAQLKSKVSGIFVDGVSNAFLVKSFSNYNYERSIYYKALKESTLAIKAENQKVNLINSATLMLFDIISVVYYVIIFFWWYYLDLSVAGVILVSQFSISIINNIRNVGYLASDFSRVYGNIKDGLELLAKPCEIEDMPDAKPIKPVDSSIKFEDVSYSYKDDSLIFKNFNLQISAGKKLGLVGRSGAGKSTLIKILCRYYDIKSGKILLGNQDISTVTQESLRQNISYVSQETSLFNRSIMENIRYGRPSASEEEIIAAAKQAYCHEFILKMPNGYKSKVGERGVMLSGGERQRISVARAILKNAPILILDEATSALDTESEKYIQQSLKNLMKNKTVIAIAHRLSTLNEMDIIAVLEKGKIVEIGSSEELLSQKGLYWKFYNMQSAGFLDIK